MPDHLMKNLRTQHWFDAVTKAAEEAGAEYSFEAAPGKGHPKLVLTMNGKTRKMAVPCSASPGLRVGNMVAAVKRKVAELMQ